MEKNKLQLLGLCTILVIITVRYYFQLSQSKCEINHCQTKTVKTC